MCGCRGDKAVEYSRKLEYLKREEELIKEEELEAEALLQPSAQTLQVLQQPLGPLLWLAAVQYSHRQYVCKQVGREPPVQTSLHKLLMLVQRSPQCY